MKAKTQKRSCPKQKIQNQWRGFNILHISASFESGCWNPIIWICQTKNKITKTEFSGL